MTIDVQGKKIDIAKIKSPALRRAITDRFNLEENNKRCLGENFSFKDEEFRRMHNFLCIKN